MKQRTPGETTRQRSIAAHHVVADTATEEGLMPYEAAAKAIFVKANGLSAYRKTTGTDSRAD